MALIEQFEKRIGGANIIAFARLKLQCTDFATLGGVRFAIKSEFLPEAITRIRSDQTGQASYLVGSCSSGQFVEIGMLRDKEGAESQAYRNTIATLERCLGLKTGNRVWPVRSFSYTP